MKRSRIRTPALLSMTLVTLTLTLTLLAGCASGADQGGGVSAEGCGMPGNVSDAIRVAGDFGSDLTLESGIPARATTFQKSLKHQGEGAQVADGLTFLGHLNIFVGSSGEVYAQEATRHVLSTEKLAPWYYNTINCARAGDRMVSIVQAIDMLGAGGGEPAGISDDDTMVVVVDLFAVLSPGDNRAVGAEQPLPEGFPEVTLAENGAPNIGIPAAFTGGSAVHSATRIVGAGPSVEATDTVLAHYRGIVARTGEMIEDTWNSESVSIPLDQALPGFSEGLTGQTVGSQVVIIVPSGGGYLPDELESKGFTAEDVMVYVVDILDVG